MLFLLLITSVYAVEECSIMQDAADIPCRVSTTWSPPNACANYTSSIYDNNGTFIYKTNLSDLGVTGLCQFIFDQTSSQCYTFNISTGDYGGLCVVESNEMIAIILYQLGIIVLFIALGYPIKAGVTKIFAWGMAIIQVFMTMWLLYLDSTSSANFNTFLFYNYWICTIIGGWVAIYVMIMLIFKSVNIANDNAPQDQYVKWGDK